MVLTPETSRHQLGRKQSWTVSTSLSVLVTLGCTRLGRMVLTKRSAASPAHVQESAR